MRFEKHTTKTGFSKRHDLSCFDSDWNSLMVLSGGWTINSPILELNEIKNFVSCSLETDCEEKVSPESNYASLDPKVSTINGIGFVGELQKRRTARTNQFFHRDRNRRCVRHVDRSTENCSWRWLRLGPVFRRRRKRRKQVQSKRQRYRWWDASNSWSQLQKVWTQSRNVSISRIWQKRWTSNQEFVFSGFRLKQQT